MQLFFLDSHATCCAQCRKDGRCDGCNHLDDELDALFLCHNAEKFLMVNIFYRSVEFAIRLPLIGGFVIPHRAQSLSSPPPLCSPPPVCSPPLC